MAARKRLSATDTAKPQPEKLRPEIHQADSPIRPPKLFTIFKIFLVFSIPYFFLLFSYCKIEYELKKPILINGLLSFIGFFVTVSLIPVASKYVSRRNLFGYDINKKGTPDGSIKVPESLGIVVGIVFLVVAILFQYFNFAADSNWLVEYNAALASICFMILLGFVDDVLDVPWRVKLVLPTIAALPLLMAYAGHTSIVIPKPLLPYVGVEILDLGWIYKLYMGLLAVFCTNSINIHAGINGLEVGQTVVIACAILIHNVVQIGASADPEYKQAHAFSIYLTQPLLATSLALLSYNWYPSSVFVGDTYTYFAGMTMAVAGILGHFSETLLIFFTPQVLNFLLSLPQRREVPDFGEGGLAAVRRGLAAGWAGAGRGLAASDWLRAAGWARASCERLAAGWARASCGAAREGCGEGWLGRGLAVARLLVTQAVSVTEGWASDWLRAGRGRAGCGAARAGSAGCGDGEGLEIWRRRLRQMTETRSREEGVQNCKI